MLYKFNETPITVEITKNPNHSSDVIREAVIGGLRWQPNQIFEVPVTVKHYKIINGVKVHLAGLAKDGIPDFFETITSQPGKYVFASGENAGRRAYTIRPKLDSNGIPVMDGETPVMEPAAHITLAEVEADETNTFMDEYDFFAMVLFSQEVIIKDMIIGAVQGHFDMVNIAVVNAE